MGGFNLNKGTILQEILETPNVITAIDRYISNKSNINSENTELIENALFIKLIHKDPLKLVKMFYELDIKKSLKEAEVSTILDKKGGSYKTMRSWLRCFEKLGYIEIQNSAPSGKTSQKQFGRARSVYFFKKKYEDIVKKLPPVYCCLVGDETLEDSNIFVEHEKQISFNTLHKYIDNVNKKLSYVRVDDEKEEAFEATKIIHSLLDCGATINEAFLILNGIFEKLVEVIPPIDKEYFSIEKKYISVNISQLLKDEKMYHLYYWYRAEEILNKSNIIHTRMVAGLMKKQILEKKWDVEYTDEEIYSEVFKQIYGLDIDDLKNKEFILLQTKQFLDTISNKKDLNDEKLNYSLLREYDKLMKIIALSILINIGHLSTNTNPIGNLKNIIATESSPILNSGDLKNSVSLMIKLRDSQDPISQYLRNQFSDDMLQLLNKFNDSDSFFPPKAVQNFLVKELNKIITSKRLNKLQCFEQIKDKISKSIGQNLYDYDDIHLNRLFLEEAYTQEIAKGIQINESIKKMKSQKSLSKFREAIKSTSRLNEKINNNINPEIKISEIESNLLKIYHFLSIN